MPLYSAGLDDSVTVQTFLGGHLVLATDDQGITRVYADDGDGNAPELTAADCAEIGAALAGLGD